jgi:hypothetical protein
MRIAITGPSGSGKTRLAAELARTLPVRHVEIDALHHGPNWQEASAEELRSRVDAALDDVRGWVVDGNYERKLGRLVIDAADTVVWLDLPRRVWLPRLLWRTARRWVTRQALWNGNRETLRGVLGGRDALVPFAWRSFAARRRRYPVELAPYPVVRLSTREAIERFLATAERGEVTRPGGTTPGARSPAPRPWRPDSAGRRGL